LETSNIYPGSISHEKFEHEDLFVVLVSLKFK